jgi:hypothetical protein
VRRALLAAACAALLGAPAAAAQAPRDHGGPLVYVFVLDGLDGDRVDQGRAPFLASLLAGEGARATYYRESRSVMVAETNPNHAAMATGAFGDRSGIPGNAFAVYDAPSRAACPQGGGAADPPGLPGAEEPPPGPQETDGEAAACLLAESIFAAARRQPGATAITTAGIFGKPKLARLFSSRREAAAPAYDADHLWAPCEDPGGDAPYCRRVPINPATGYAASDGVVMDEVLRSIREGVETDGARKRPNLTFVNFPQIDSAGHATGTGAAYDAAIAQADAELRRFAGAQRAAGLWRRTVLFVVSDHSMDQTASKTNLRSAFEAAGIPGGEYLIVQNGSVDMVYLADRDRPDRDAVLARMRAAALGPAITVPPTAGTRVDEALYRLPNASDGGLAHTLDAVHPGWRVAGERTGDLFVTHASGGAFSDPANPLTGNHGGPLTTDNTFAVISGGAQVRRQALSGVVDDRYDDTLRNPGQAQNVDVAPTVMRLLGRRPPLDSQGRVLEEAFAPGVLPPAGSLPGAGARSPAATGCAAAAAIRSVRVRPARRGGLRIGFRRTGARRVTVDVFRQSRGRTVLGNRLAARFRGRSRGFTWRPRRAGRGVYVVRLRAGGDVRRLAVRRARGRFSRLPAFERAARCDALRLFKLERPVLGGRRNRAVDIAFALRRDAVVSAVVRHRGRIVRRYPARQRAAGQIHRLRLASEGLERGRHRIVLTVRADAGTLVARLAALRL